MVMLRSTSGRVLDGLFLSTHWRGSRKKAKEASLLERCVRKTLSDTGKHVTASGARLDVKRYPLCGATVSDYGGCVALVAYLRFTLECAAFLLLLFAFSTYPLINNIERNAHRNDCRNVQSERPDSCGLTGEPTRTNITNVTWWMSMTLGSCEEYSDVSDILHPFSPPDPFVAPAQNRTASFCLEQGSVADWLCVAIVFLQLLWLVRLRRLERTTAQRVDAANLTTADYALLLSGLERGCPAQDEGDTPGLQRRVYADLARLGFPAETIAFVEVGQVCGEEVRLLRKLAAIKIAQHEVASRNQQRQARRFLRAKGESASLALQREKLEAEASAVRADLQKLTSTPHLTTGHAFVVFQLTADRDACLRRLRWNWRAALRAACCGGEMRPRLEAAAGGGGQGGGGWGHVDASVPPEPSDVAWENLQEDESWRTRQIAMTYVAITPLLIGSCCAFVVVRAAQATAEEEMPLVEKVEEEAGVTADQAAMAYSLGLTAVSALVVGITNLLLKGVLIALTRREQHATATAYEISLQAKLSLAYVLNSVVLPLAFGVVQSAVVTLGSTRGLRLANQGWYEGGGVVTQAALLLGTDLVLRESLKLLQPQSLARRYVLAPLAVSQHRLTRLWAPPPPLLAELYAAVTKTIALTLLYAPLFPLFYVLGAVAVLLVRCSTTLAIRYWYRRPPAVAEQMVVGLRHAWNVLIPLQLGVHWLGTAAASGGSHTTDVLGADTRLSPLLAGLGLWLLFQLAPLRLLRCLGRHVKGIDPGRVVPEGPTARHGLRFDDVAAVTKREVDRYRCPVASRDGGLSLEADLYRRSFASDFVDPGTWSAAATVDVAAPFDTMHESAVLHAQGTGDESPRWPGEAERVAPPCTPDGCRGRADALPTSREAPPALSKRETNYPTASLPTLWPSTLSLATAPSFYPEVPHAMPSEPPATAPLAIAPSSYPEVPHAMPSEPPAAPPLATAPSFYPEVPHAMPPEPPAPSASSLAMPHVACPPPPSAAHASSDLMSTSTPMYPPPLPEGTQMH